MTSKILTITLVLCLVPSITGQTGASTTRPSDANALLSEANFAIVAQDIRELKRPEFRALLRARLIGLTRTSDSTERRQASLAVATEALSDLCASQDEILQPQAVWLYGQVTEAIKKFDPAGAESLAGKFSLKKDESVSDAALDLAAAITAMSDPAKASSARERATADILTGEVPLSTVMGHLLRLQNSNPSGLAPLLSATLTVEDQTPGFFPLRLFPFLAGVFLANTTPAEIQTRFVALIVSRTRLSTEELADFVVRSQVANALQAIAEKTKSLAPALYAEVATRLNSLAPAATAMRAERQAAEDRIKTSSDQLEQMQSEAERTSDSNYRSGLLARAGGLALTQGKLRKAIDLAVSAYGDASANSIYLDRFLASVISPAAVKKEEPDVIIYAVSKMGKPLNKAKGLMVLCKYYAAAKETEKTAAALHDAAKALKDAPADNEKLAAAISLAKGFVEYDRAAAFDAFRQIVDTINKLPAPEKQKEKSYYVSLMPIADELIKSFRLLSAQDESGAFTIAQDIKVAELRVSALSGVYSRSRDITK
ncbi:MAG TPA: hypothetical protein VHP99_05795 [Pyrinomonadaceae bacterium]|nr:hypothetical protein [Pyrinomonadaceae bacterium]